MVVERASGSSASARGNKGPAEQPAPSAARQRCSLAHTCEYLAQELKSGLRAPGAAERDTLKTDDRRAMFVGEADPADEIEARDSREDANLEE